MKKSYIIGITGDTGSGKSFISNQIIEAVGYENAVVCKQDNYYLPLDQQFIDENGVANFDLPEALDLNQYKMDVEALSLGRSIFQQEYYYNRSDESAKKVEILPKKIIILEGMFIFYLKDLVDLKIFVESDEELKLERRINRDLAERGYDEMDVKYRFKHHIMPAYLKYVSPQKFDADMIIPNNHNHKEIKALELIIDHLKCKVG